MFGGYTDVSWGEKITNVNANVLLSKGLRF